ncbi:YdcF family protein [Glaciimonas sp. Gout2]|uniref:YdcF family protein n=1 Tax=unclassified Glaciimonas TaxID=2644401 RepID=UPI002B230488|nr:MULTISPECIES: YdcF family protein [unclassified Glaciimonas]MEB0013791.1 YdcF family protein [Glaciimonas sp. Cout2]MEB0083106.1 YdcF family protein [Glaciimonas sp. Gout2]
MHIALIINNLVSTFLLPPTSLMLVCFLGLALRRRYSRCGLSLSVGALIIMLVISTKAGSLLFVAPLENQAPVLNMKSIGDAQAIVVLGGGRLANSPEYGDVDSPSYVTLARLRYAAKLHRETGLPILVTGGQPEGGGESEAAVMARSLEQDFGTPVKWIEDASDNTAQNASLSYAILSRDKVKHILLVTDAIHMPRARMIFKQSGLDGIPAPTVFFSRSQQSLLDFMPTGEGLRRSYYALHEWIGIVWYRLRY